MKLLADLQREQPLRRRGRNVRKDATLTLAMLRTVGMVLLSFARTVVAADHVVIELSGEASTYKHSASAVLKVASPDTYPHWIRQGEGAAWVRGSSSRVHPKKAFRIEFQVMLPIRKRFVVRRKFFKVDGPVE